ncbi:hypothetical protein [Actinocorallia sp. A-T 12471]|uniref:hypothetical protein n=1 Tax=Actinocorallia sp. A-T 12471 TaxID=3089813 RepID=UPI0029D3DE65|nr:hypothetical protein [Actinocorallia sp. A-T 12471]MDX6740416.1 hypothetical protein [Actinocorallia sp. A-T 12471]
MELADIEVRTSRQLEALRGQFAEIEEKIAAAEKLLESVALIKEEIERSSTETVDVSRTMRKGNSDQSNVDVPRQVHRAEPRQPLSAAMEQAVRVLHDAQRPMRARDVVEALGDVGVRGKVESMRIRLKRLVEYGWLEESETGRYAVVGEVGALLDEMRPKAPRVRRGRATT